MSCYPQGFKSRRRSSTGSVGSPTTSNAMGWFERWSSKTALTFLDGFQCVSNGSSPLVEGLQSPELSAWCNPQHHHQQSDYEFFHQHNRDEYWSSADEDRNEGDEEEDDNSVYEYFDKQNEHLRPIKFRPPTAVGADPKQQQSQQKQQQKKNQEFHLRTQSAMKPQLGVENHRANGGDVARSFETATTASLSASWSSESGHHGHLQQQASTSSSNTSSPRSQYRRHRSYLDYVGEGEEYDEDEDLLEVPLTSDNRNQEETKSVAEWNSSTSTVLVAHVEKPKQQQILSSYRAASSQDQVCCAKKSSGRQNASIPTGNQGHPPRYPSSYSSSHPRQGTTLTIQTQV